MPYVTSEPHEHFRRSSRSSHYDDLGVRFEKLPTCHPRCTKQDPASYLYWRAVRWANLEWVNSWWFFANLGHWSMMNHILAGQVFFDIIRQQNTLMLSDNNKASWIDESTCLYFWGATRLSHFVCPSMQEDLWTWFGFLFSPNKLIKYIKQYYCVGNGFFVAITIHITAISYMIANHSFIDLSPAPIRFRPNIVPTGIFHVCYTLIPTRSIWFTNLKHRYHLVVIQIVPSIHLGQKYVNR